jgi:hypothetical protein
MNTSNKIYFTLALLFTTVYVSGQEVYSLNWNKKETFKITCGIIYHDTWEVRNDTCSFSSGTILFNKNARQDLKAQITLRHDGNLTGMDVAYGYIFVNEVIVKSFTVAGNEVEDVFVQEENFSITGKSTVSVRLVFNGSDAERAWQLNSGDIKIVKTSTEDEPYVTATFDGKTSKVTWQAKTNQSSNYFVVERSSNGTDFVLTGLVKAEPSSALREYSLIDRVQKDATVFYRVKAKEFGGNEQQIGDIIRLNTEGGLSGSIAK